ncbi:MAG: hypothetical protein K9K39_03265 [Desulfohalobiaceae bacterium]|nr:hypothetical protein [Desulfohalobiaceae bacterium]
MTTYHYLRTENPDWAENYAIFAFQSHGLVRVFGTPVEEVRDYKIELNHGTIWPDLCKEHMIATGGQQLHPAKEFENLLGFFDDAQEDNIGVADTFWPEALRLIKRLNNRQSRFTGYLKVLLPGIDGDVPKHCIVQPGSDGWSVWDSDKWYPVEGSVAPPKTDQEATINPVEPPQGETFFGAPPPVNWPVEIVEAK